MSANPPPRPAQVRPLPLGAITNHADVFKAFAAQHPELLFFLTRVGCGSAGFSDRQIAPLFLNAPANVLQPPEWGRDSARHRDSDRTKKTDWAHTRGQSVLRESFHETRRYVIAHRLGLGVAAVPCVHDAHNNPSATKRSDPSKSSTNKSTQHGVALESQVTPGVPHPADSTPSCSNG